MASTGQSSETATPNPLPPPPEEEEEEEEEEAPLGLETNMTFLMIIHTILYILPVSIFMKYLLKYVVHLHPRDETVCAFMGLILGYLLVIVVNFFLVGIWMDKLKHEEKKNEAMEREMHLLDVQINRLAVLLREVTDQADAHDEALHSDNESDMDSGFDINSDDLEDIEDIEDIEDYEIGGSDESTNGSSIDSIDSIDFSFLDPDSD